VDLDLLTAYRWMRLTRSLDDSIRNLWLTGQGVGGTFNQRGHEAISVGAALCLADDDIVAPMHRDLGAFLVRGMSARRLIANQLGRATGVSNGRDANIHGCGDLSLGIIGFVSHLPQSLPVAVGAAMAFRYRGEARVALTFTGDGGSIAGLYAESLNLAALDRAPVVIVVENNQYAYSTPIAEHSANPDIAQRSRALGVHTVEVDGNNVVAVHHEVLAAVNRARNGGGPTVVVADTMRMLGHAIHDGFEYVPDKLLERWHDRDPLKGLERRLKEAGVEATEVKAIDEEVAAVVADAVTFARESPWPDPRGVADGVWA
jgi:TPP-dependent pyruvate/acetoin dehydrogenase alpha subunit